MAVPIEFSYILKNIEKNTNDYELHLAKMYSESILVVSLISGAKYSRLKTITVVEGGGPSQIPGLNSCQRTVFGRSPTPSRHH